jgi:hypothetical protein
MAGGRGEEEREGNRDVVKATACPKCGRKLDVATCTYDEALVPKPGDFSVCIGCAEVLRFDHELEPVLAVPAELAELDPEMLARLERSRAAIRRLRGVPRGRR